MDDGIHVGYSALQAGAGGQIALHPVGAGARLAAQHSHAVAGATEVDHDLAAERARAAGDEDVHRAPILVEGLGNGSIG